ncbi:MAG: Ig-like domain-containing protein [Paludibacteraceae bacterium]|nr:Ig-like domain-containing protein [Paludibacteraceae bacterium]
MSSIFTGSNQSATVTDPVDATVTTTSTASNAKSGKLGSDNQYFQIVLSTEKFSDVVFNGSINTNDVSKNWGFQFSTDGGATWKTEIMQAHDGIKEAHDIMVNADIPSNANGIRIIRHTSTSTVVNSITLTLGSATYYAVTYKANNGTSEADVVDLATRKAADCTFTAPANQVFKCWNTAANGSGNSYKPGQKVESDLTLYAQWKEITACAVLLPAASGATPAKGAEVALKSDSKGGKIIFAGAKDSNFEASFTYTADGLQMNKGGADSVRVQLDDPLQAGAIIELKVVQSMIENNKTRGFYLQSAAKNKVLEAAWVPTAVGEERTFSYTVKANDGLEGKNVFIIARNNSAVLASVTVSNCGEEEEPEKSNIATLNKISYAFGGENISLEGLPTKKEFEVELPYGTVASDITNFAYDPTDSKVSSKTDDFSSMTALPYTVTINVTAEDGIAKEAYKVTFKVKESGLSHDATLSSITYGSDQTPIPDFDPAVTKYTIELPYNTTEAPKVHGIATAGEKASIEPAQATTIPGTANILVTAEDGTTKKSYLVKFELESEDKWKDATLKSLKYGETDVPEFAATTLFYNVKLTYGIKTPPTVTAETNHPRAKADVTQASSVPGIATVNVTAEDGTTKSKYEVNYYVVAPEHPVTGVTLNETTMEMETGDEDILVASVAPDNATNSAVTWKSDNTAAVTVDASGNIKAVGEGTATVTVTTAESEYTAQCVITVTKPAGSFDPATSVSLNKTSLTLYLGQSEILEATVSPETADPEVTWSSADATIATVDEFGEVTAIKAGSTKIKATSADGNKYKECSLTVKEYDLTVSPTSKTLVVGETFTIQGKLNPADDEAIINWESSDESVATVDDNGEVTALKAGSATIKASTANSSKKPTCNVTVKEATPKSVVLTPETASLDAGETLQLTATIDPESIQETAVKEWKSSKTAVATVDANGLVTAVAIGEAEIQLTVKSGGSSKSSNKVKITVSAAPDDPSPGDGKDLQIHVPDKYEEDYKAKLVQFKDRYYEVYYINRDADDKLSIATSSTDKAGAITTSSDKKSTAAKDGWATIKTSSDAGGDTGGAKADEFEQSIRKISLKDGDKMLLRVVGFDEFALYGKDNSETEAKSLMVYINGKKQTSTLSKSYTIRRYTLDKSKSNIIKVTASGSSNSNVVAFSLRETNAPRLRYYDGNDTTQKVRITDAIQPITYYLKNGKAEGAQYELKWADDNEATGISISANTNVDTLTLEGAPTCAPGEYTYTIVTTQNGEETSSVTGKIHVITDLKALTDTLIDAYAGEDMDQLILRYYAPDATSIHIAWKNDQAPQGLTFNDNSTKHTYSLGGVLNGSGSYQFTITMDGNPDVRITGTIDVIVQELGVNPILFLYSDKKLRVTGSDNVKDTVYTSLRSRSYNLRARRVLNEGERSDDFYKKFKAIVISEDVPADNTEVLSVVSGKANLPVLNMKAFTYPRVEGNWGVPDNGTIDTISQNGSKIFVQRNEHPIFASFTGVKYGDTIQIFDFKKLKEAGINSVMPIAVNLQGTYCLATAYTRCISADLDPQEAYYLDGERQTIIHEIPKDMRDGQKYICFPLSRQSTDFLTKQGKQLLGNIMNYLLTSEAATITPATCQIKSFMLGDEEAEIDQTENIISMEMSATTYAEMDSLRTAKPKITLADAITYVTPNAEQTLDLSKSMYIPYKFVVSDYIQRREYSFKLTIKYEQGIEEVYTVGEWVNIYDIYGRMVTTTNENIYTMDLPQGIYIAVTATGHTVKLMK